MSNVTIYHNPNCGTSRNTLALIREAGIEPTVVEYLKTPLSRAQLLDLVTQLGGQVRDLLRSKQMEYEELHLEADTWSDDGLIDTLLEHPILFNRPVVVTPLGAKVCRPAELVLDLLPKQA